MSLLPNSSSEHLPRNEDNTLIEMSLFSELIRDESIIDSMIRELRYERNHQMSQEDLRLHDYKHTIREDARDEEIIILIGFALTIVL